MQRFSLGFGVAALLALTACDVTAPPPETCTDATGAVFVKPASGCPPIVAKPVKKAAVVKPKAKAAPVVVKTAVAGGDGGGDAGGDGGSDGGTGW